MWLGSGEATFPPWTENMAQVAVTWEIFSQVVKLDSLGLLTSAKILIAPSQHLHLHFEANHGSGNYQEI